MAQLNNDLDIIKSARDNMKLALEGKGQMVTKDIRTYAEAISNISGGGGSGDVKLFETEQEMQADATAQEGDLAVVYRSEQQNAQADSIFASATFPASVTLPEAVEDYITVTYRSADQSSYFDMNGELSSEGFGLSGWGEQGEVRIEYTSQDGIHYTRIDGGDETINFGVEIQKETYEEWNELVGYFIQIGGNYFEGLYQCHENYTDSNLLQFINLSDVTFSKTTPTWNGNYFNTYYDVNKIKKLINKIFLTSGRPNMDASIYLNNNNQVCLYIGGINSSFFGAGTSAYCFNTNTNEFLGIGASTSVQNAYVYTLNLEEQTYVMETITVTDYLTASDSNRYYYAPITPKSLLIEVEKYDGQGTDFRFSDSELRAARYGVPNSSTAYTSVSVGYEVFNANINPTFSERYALVSTQLDAGPQDVYKKLFYGVNGIETGTLGDIVADTFNDNVAELYVKIQNAYDNMTPLVASNDWKTAGLGTDIVIIPTKSDGTPLLDTSNVTNMSYMFSHCPNLTSIPQLDTSNVTNMAWMFYDCTSLTIIPLLDTSNVTNMYCMFQTCNSLTSIPQFNTSNVTDMSYMFDGCTSLTIIPLLDTSNVTDMHVMFNGCTNLTTIPLLDTSNVTDMQYMFQNCTSLTTIPLLDTSNVTNMDYMFNGCTSLQEIDLSGGTINSSAKHTNIFINVPTNCTIYVKDQASKTLLESWDNTHTYTIKT